MTATLHEPRFLSIDEVLLLHQLGIQEFGGDPGLRDRGLLESAIAQARAAVEGKWLNRYPFEMAAAYAFHICQNHSFVDGNKRVAWSAMRTFLHREGFYLRVASTEAVSTMLQLASGEIDKTGLAAWIEAHVSPRPRMELRDFFLSMTTEELCEKLVAIAQSYHSGGSAELTAVVNDSSVAIPAISGLAYLYEHRRSDNENAIHFIQLLCALYRIAEEKGYEW